MRDRPQPPSGGSCLREPVALAPAPEHHVEPVARASPEPTSLSFSPSPPSPEPPEPPEPNAAPSAPKAVSLLLLAQNVDMARLCAQSGLAAAFRQAIQQDLAEELGQGLRPEDVEVRLGAQSAALPVVVTPPQSGSLTPHHLHSLLSTTQLRWAAVSRLSGLDSFGSVCLGASWGLCSVGMPSIVSPSLADAEDPPAEEHSPALPRSLQRSVHTPRDSQDANEAKAKAKARRVLPKQKAMAKACIALCLGKTCTQFLGGLVGEANSCPGGWGEGVWKYATHRTSYAAEFCSATRKLHEQCPRRQFQTLV